MMRFSSCARLASGGTTTGAGRIKSVLPAVYGVAQRIGCYGAGQVIAVEAAKVIGLEVAKVQSDRRNWSDHA